MAFKPLPLGAGGFITAGIQFANDGTAVCGGDAFGAWVKGPTASKWTCLYESGRLPSGDIGLTQPNNYPTYVDESQGCWGITIAPTDSSRIYMTYNGLVYKSTNGGTTFTRVAGPYVMKSAGGGANAGRDPQRRFIVDPRNANVVMIGPQEGKIIYTLDGFATAAVVLTVPAGNPLAGNPAEHKVAIDPSSAVSPVGGVSQKCAYSVDGGASAGIWQSTTGPGGTYSLLTGSPANARAMIYDAAGNLWALQRGETTNGNLYKKTPAGSFAKVNTPTLEWKTIAIDPQNTNSIVLAGDNGDLARSLDGGANWIINDSWHSNWPGPYGISYFPTAIKWMGDGNGNPGRGNRFFPSELSFHPTNGRCYAAQGIGVCWSLPPSSFVEWSWFDDSLGLEELETSHVMVPPGGKCMVSTHDQGMFKITDEDKWKNIRKFGDPAVGFGHAWFCDYVPGSPNILVMTCAFTQNANGKSTDYGDTWTALGAHPSGFVAVGGAIIPSSATKFFWFPSNNFQPAKSLDGGATWTALSLPGVPTSGETGFGYSMWGPKHDFCSDKANGDVYAWNYGNSTLGPAASWAGVWKYTASSDSWARVFAGIPTGASNGSAVNQMECVPGQAGHVVFKGDGGSMSRSTNGGTTWAAVGGFSNCYAFGFGKAAPGQTYPAIFAYGVRSGTLGLYRCDDGTFNNWTFLGGFPGNQIGSIHTLCGHPDVYGKVYIGFDHNAGVIGEYDFRLTLS